MLAMDLAGMMLAAVAPGDSGMAVLGAAIGCGLVIIGAGLGIGMIGGKSLEAIARQPESSSRIFSTMIIAAALVEGVTFFALVICLLVTLWFH
jgi:F-type H+-transporting ATPase subunit c